MGLIEATKIRMYIEVRSFSSLVYESGGGVFSTSATKDEPVLSADCRGARSSDCKGADSTPPLAQILARYSPSSSE